MFSVAAPGFLLFAALFVMAWYRLPPARRWQAMLCAGILFYLSLDGAGFLVLLASTLAVWYLAGKTGRAALIAGLAAALGPLLLLKYSGFAAKIAGITLGSLLQPLGLAYFTLQLASYLIDVYTGRIEREKNPLKLLCYASFFLSITQGPFVRYDRLMPQLGQETAFDNHRLWRGAMRMAWGYFKKYAIASRFAVVVDVVFADPASFDRSQLLFAAVLYSLQLYADFSGYTDLMLGVGEALGLQLPENFSQPFLASTVHELWARWHISLSQWLRDYVYIPLGGSRNGAARWDLNLILTFLVSGLWHGANWTFLVWGALHGLIQAIENHLPWRKGWGHGLKRLPGIAGTFLIFVFTFTIFRADSLSTAITYFDGILHNGGFAAFGAYWQLGLGKLLDLALIFAAAALLLTADLLHEKGVSVRDWVAARPAVLRWVFYETALLLFLFMGQFLGSGGFLYARF